jgi:hypothetical protein
MASGQAPAAPPPLTRRHVIVRTYSAGVHFGILTSQSGKEVVLSFARRLWYWRGAFTLNAVAMSGVGEGSKVSEAVPSITLTEAIEIIDCAQPAIENLSEVKAWKA